MIQVGAVLTKLLMDTAQIDVAQRDAWGRKTGPAVGQPAFWHGLVNGYDDKGKGWWKKFGMVTMHDDLLHRLTDQEVRADRHISLSRCLHARAYAASCLLRKCIMRCLQQTC